MILHKKKGGAYLENMKFSIAQYLKYVFFFPYTYTDRSLFSYLFNFIYLRDQLSYIVHIYTQTEKVEVEKTKKFQSFFPPRIFLTDII